MPLAACWGVRETAGIRSRIHNLVGCGVAARARLARSLDVILHRLHTIRTVPVQVRQGSILVEVNLGLLQPLKERLFHRSLWLPLRFAAASREEHGGSRPRGLRGQRGAASCWDANASSCCPTAKCRSRPRLLVAGMTVLRETVNGALRLAVMRGRLMLVLLVLTTAACGSGPAALEKVTFQAGVGRPAGEGSAQIFDPAEAADRLALTYAR